MGKLSYQLWRRNRNSEALPRGVVLCPLQLKFAICDSQLRGYPCRHALFMNPHLARLKIYKIYSAALMLVRKSTFAIVIMAPGSKLDPIRRVSVSIIITCLHDHAVFAWKPGRTTRMTGRKEQDHS